MTNQLHSPASPSLVARINELATLHGKCSREWGESGANSQRDMHAGMSNLCLEILDWIERNPTPTANVEQVDLQKLADALYDDLLHSCNREDDEGLILTALQQVATSNKAEIERLVSLSDSYRCDVVELSKDLTALTKRAEAAEAKNKVMQCAYCLQEFDRAAAGASEALTDHVLTCEKSPLVQMRTKAEAALASLVIYVGENIDDCDLAISNAKGAGEWNRYYLLDGERIGFVKMQDKINSLQPEFGATILARLNALEDRNKELEGESNSGSFKLMEDETTKRRYWHGAEDGWMQGTEIGSDGILTIDGKHFEAGTILTIAEPALKVSTEGGKTK